MARKRYNTAEEWNRSLGYSDESLTALKAGKYDQMTGRDPRYRTSDDQVRAARELPVLDGLLQSIPEPQHKFGRRVDTEEARRNYAANHIPIGKGLVQKDADLIANAALNMLNNNISADEAANNMRTKGITSNYAKNKNWEEEYGKSLETLIEEYANSDLAMNRHFSEVGSKGSGLSNTVGAMGMNAFIKPVMGARTLPANLISPDSERTKKLNRASSSMSEVTRSAKDSTLQNAGTVGKGLYEFGTTIGERMSRDLTPFGWILNGLATAEDTRQELEREGVSNRKSAGYGLARGTLDAIASKFAGKLGQNANGRNFATRAIKSGAKQGALGGAEQIIAELADRAILGDEGTYNRDIQNYMARGLSEEEARDRAWENTLLRIGGMAATRGTIGALTSLGGDALRGVQNKLKDLAYRAYIDRYVVDPDDPIFNEDIIDIDELNEYFAPQNAIEGNAVPRLTGTVDDELALPGNGQLPALVDNIYPIQMPGTNGVINLPGKTAPIQLPDLSAKSAPVGRPMNEAAGWVNPRLVKALEGADLEKANASVASNKTQIEALKNEIEILKNDKGNLYRGNLKKAVQKEITAKEKQIKSLEKANKDLGLQIKGGIKPVLDMLTPQQKNAIYDTSGKHDSVFSKINFAVKFAGDTPEAKALARQAQNAIREYVKTGSTKAVKEMSTALQELNNMAKTVNATYTSGKGNEWNYESAFGDQAQYLSGLQPVADIYNAETRAARAQNVPQTAGESAPVQTPTPQTANNEGLYPEEIAAKALEDKYSNLKQYSNQPVMVRKSEIPEDVLSFMLGENFDNQLDSVKLGGELAKRGYNVWENGYNNNMMSHAWSIMEDAVAHHLAKDLIPSATMAEAYDIVAQRGGTLDEAVRLAAQMAGTQIDEPVPGSMIQIGDGTSAPVEAPKKTEGVRGQTASLNVSASTPSDTNAPQPVQNVNTIPEVTNEPNFTTVGDPYTPQEVPNVQPTPPTNNVPPTGDGPDNGGNMKTSQYYKNTMRGTETNRDMSDEEYAKRFDEEIYKRMTVPERQSVDMGRNFINESGGNEAAIQRLLSGDFDSEERFSGYHIDAAQMLANDIERQALDMEAQGQDASALWRTANKLHKKIQQNASEFGVGMQALQKWKRSTPQGAYDSLISEINKGIDKKKTTGYTRNVNNLVDKIEDAIENTEDKATLISKIKDIFAKDREKNPYNTQKAEQLVLNLVGGDKNTKKSVTDLIEDASRVIKKEMGVSTLSPKDERAIVNLLNEASKLEPGTRPYNVLVSRAMTIVDDSLPVTMSEKVKSLLYDNMLASIKTMFTRNFGGNLVGNAIDAMAAPFQVGADALVGKFTGVRTRALTGKSIIAAAKGMGHGFSEWGQDIGYSIKNKTAFNTARSGQESLSDVLRAVHKTWKTQSDNKVAKALTHALSAYDYVIRKGMEGGDRPIYEAQYAATKAELYHVVDKYGDAGLRKGLPADKRDIDTDDLIEAIAINEGLEAVLQNDSKMKEAAKNFKAGFKNASEDMFGIDIASMAHAPFVEVPANMASNFFKLTPVGWIGNAKRTFNEKRKYGSINQRRFTGELGLNVLGGLLGVGGFAAADKFISGPYSDDPNERKLQQNNGYLEYALQTPDGKHQVDISDIPYLGPGLKFTKMERDAYNENGLKGMLEELPSATGAATVDSLFQSLNRLTGADFQTGGSGNFLKNAWNNIKSSPGSMLVPSYIRQTAQFLDPYKRDLGDYGTSEYNKNLVINGIPLLRQAMLEPKIDTAGQKVPELGGSTGVGRFMAAYVNPYKVSHPHENMSAVQEYIDGLKQSTDGAVNPQMRAISKKDITGIKGYNKENYNHADLRRFQEEYYNLNTELGNTLIQDPWFTNLSEEKQGKILNDLWSANLALVKENFVRNGLTEEQIAEAGEDLYTTDDKLAATIRDDDEKHTGLLQWLHDETDRNELNAKYGTEMNHDNYVKYNERGENYAEQRMSETEIAKSLGMTVDSYEKYEKEYPTGAKGYAEDKQAALDYGFVDSDNSANVDAYNIAKELGNGDPTVIQAYSDYKQEGIKSNAYGAKAGYLANEDRLTDEQKGMIIAGSQDGSKVSSLAGGAKQLYDIGGYAGINYYYLIKSIAEPTYGTSLSKKERAAFFAEDHPELDALWNYEQTPGDKKGQEMYYYLQANLK